MAILAPKMARGMGWQLIVASSAHRVPKLERRKKLDELESQIPLKSRARDFFKRKNLGKDLTTEEDVIIYGVSGVEYEVDFVLTSSQPSNCQRVAVLVRDYKGPAKVTNIHQAAHLQNDSRDIDRVLLVSNRISGPAKNLAKRSGIQTLSREEIHAMYRHEGWDLAEK
ncbi:MAG: restriction endonuclease [Candidatus Heimdallarchaeota archaeon]